MKFLIVFLIATTFGLLFQNCSKQEFKSNQVTNSYTASSNSLEDDSQLKIAGINTITSKRVLNPNDLWTGVFGFDENSGQDFPSGTRRAQLSPDGKIWFQFNGVNQWEIAAIKPLSAPGVVEIDSTANINGINIDAARKQKIVSGESRFRNDNSSYSYITFNKGLGGQLAIGFNPLFAAKGIPMEDNLDSCEIDQKPEFSPKLSARYECLHLLVHQRGYYNRNDVNTGQPICPYTSANQDDPGNWPCIMIAPLVVRLDQSNKLNPEIIYAHLGKFRPIRMNYPTGPKAVRQLINEYAATSDSGLIFFINSKVYYPGSPDDLVIAYTFNANPYLPLSEAGDWASKGWSPPRSLWHLYDDFKNGTELVRGLRGGFRKAYPMAQYPFRFANGVRIREGLGRYQWFSPEGSGMMVNIGARAIASALGRETRGIIKHVDSSAQLTRRHYCRVNPTTHLDCNPNRPDGDLGCSVDNCAYDPDNNPNTKDSVSLNGNIMGIQEYTSMGTSSGFWSLPQADLKSENAQPVIPFQRRLPQWSVLFNNKALHAFHPDAAKRADHRWIYTEVAHDDFEDPDFLVFFHMNEAIFNSKQKDSCQFGTIRNGNESNCNISVIEAFENKDANNQPFVVDTSKNSYLGRLGGADAAQFPFEYWKERGIGERIQGNPQGTGEVNPGFRGRAVHFHSSSFLKVEREENLATKLIEEKREMTVELAMRLNRQYHPASKSTSASYSNTYSGTLIRQMNSWAISLESGRLRLAVRAADGSSEVMIAPLASDSSSEDWSHYVVRIMPSNPNDVNSLLKAQFFENGNLIFSSNFQKIRKLLATSSSEYLCVGPGCLSGASQQDLWLDEVAVSNVARKLDYIRAAANVTNKIASINVKRSSEEWPSLVGPSSLKGLDTNDLLIPTVLLDLYDKDPIKLKRIGNLGRALFHDPLLSSDKLDHHNHRSCSSCHAESTGFTSPTHAQKEIGLDGKPLRFNSPTILNRAFSIRQFFDERSPNVLLQAAGPINNPLEMGANTNIVMSRINGDKSHQAAMNDGPFLNVPKDQPIIHPTGVRTYKEWFCFAFENEKFAAGDKNCGGVERTTNELLIALATYELQQTAGDSLVDKMKLGESYLDRFSHKGFETSLKEGYQIFLGKGRCVGCHSGNNYSDELVHQNGPLGADGHPLKIKTPTLRKLQKTFPYFHDGSNGGIENVPWCQYDKVETPAGYQLCQVVEYYHRGACRMSDLIKLRQYNSFGDHGTLKDYQVDDIACDSESVSLGLSEQEKRNLVEFLMHL